MHKKHSGFTLIELIIVIVILGILAVVAIPKYINLSQDAYQAATNGIAGSLASASIVNYAARKENSVNGVAITNCTQVPLALQGGVLPTGYSIATLAIAADATVTCALTGLGSPATTANFSAIGVL